jgi:hypothetical protein
MGQNADKMFPVNQDVQAVRHVAASEAIVILFVMFDHGVLQAYNR